jgi:hypothetical protein
MRAQSPITRSTALQGLVSVLLGGWALSSWAQDPAPETPPPAASPTPWTYSLGLRSDIADLRHPGTQKLHLNLGLRYGRWRIGSTDGSNWHRFGQVLQDSGLAYDLRQDSKWSMAVSGSIINLDQSGQFDAIKAGRKTLRAKAGVDYRLPNRWSVGLIATQDLFMRGDGTTLSPTLTYRHPLSEVSTLMLSQSMTWASSAHWQTQQALDPLARTHQGTGLGEYAVQLAYRQRLSLHWAFFSQLGAQHTLSPVHPSSLNTIPSWNYSGQFGVVYFAH